MVFGRYWGCLVGVGEIDGHRYCRLLIIIVMMIVDHLWYMMLICVPKKVRPLEI